VKKGGLTPFFPSRPEKEKPPGVSLQANAGSGETIRHGLADDIPNDTVD
jgi:hypothetical protein